MRLKSGVMSLAFVSGLMRTFSECSASAAYSSRCAFLQVFSHLALTRCSEMKALCRKPGVLAPGGSSHLASSHVGLWPAVEEADFSFPRTLFPSVIREEPIPSDIRDEARTQSSELKIHLRPWYCSQKPSWETGTRMLELFREISWKDVVHVVSVKCIRIVWNGEIS